MKKIVIIKTGKTFPGVVNTLGDFEDWIFKGLGIDKENFRVVDVTTGEPLPPVDTLKGVVIAGSHSMVTQNYSWSLAIEKWVPQLIRSETPLLGICYGHQLIAKAMGGKVDYHIDGVEIGTTQIKFLPEYRWDRLFAGLPETFLAHAYHSQTVVTLPDNAVRLACNSFEPNHAFRIGGAAWGVQFHPESNERIMTAYAENMEAEIKKSGLVLSEILERIKLTPVALEILKRFGQMTR